LPDARRPLRRSTRSRLLTRTIAHLTVVGLVASAAAFGLVQARASEASDTSYNDLFRLVSTARAGGAETEELRSTTFTIEPQPLDEPDLFPRSAPAILPTESPKPTPVPIDPAAPPLPGPNRVAVGTTERPFAPAVTVVAPVGGPLAWPVPAGSITQYFHAGHLAVDIAASYGSSVVAAEAGVVTSAGWRNNGGGLVISIDHGNGIQTLYNHLGSIWVNAGQAVARGQGIAGVGCTGICTGPHVHFEVIANGVIQNPMRFL
jgi:murein DD-endopeptidase MepM/ murein hydrolase activator NlpD